VAVLLANRRIERHHRAGEEILGELDRETAQRLVRALALGGEAGDGNDGRRHNVGDGDPEEVLAPKTRSLEPGARVGQLEESAASVILGAVVPKAVVSLEVSRVV